MEGLRSGEPVTPDDRKAIADSLTRNWDEWTARGYINVAIPAKVIEMTVDAVIKALEDGGYLPSENDNLQEGEEQ